MKAEDQVCSLSQAKKLRDLGVKQESQFYYDRYGCVKFIDSVVSWGYEQTFRSEYFLDDKNSPEPEDIYSAFTVAELGEMIDARYSSHKSDDKYDNNLGKYFCHSTRIGEKRFYGKTEAECRADALIYLIQSM